MLAAQLGPANRLAQLAEIKGRPEACRLNLGGVVSHGAIVGAIAARKKNGGDRRRGRESIAAPAFGDGALAPRYWRLGVPAPRLSTKARRSAAKRSGSSQ